MIKEKYIKMRNNNKFETGWFYDYFTQNGGEKIDINMFSQILNNMFNLNEILDFLDSKFELTKLYSKDGKFIKIIE